MHDFFPLFFPALSFSLPLSLLPTNCVNTLCLPFSGKSIVNAWRSLSFSCLSTCSPFECIRDKSVSHVHEQPYPCATLSLSHVLHSLVSVSLIHSLSFPLFRCGSFVVTAKLNHDFTVSCKTNQTHLPPHLLCRRALRCQHDNVPHDISALTLCCQWHQIYFITMPVWLCTANAKADSSDFVQDDTSAFAVPFGVSLVRLVFLWRGGTFTAAVWFRFLGVWVLAPHHLGTLWFHLAL